MGRQGDGTRETVLREIRASAAAWWNVLDLSGSTQALVMLDRAPWRAIAMTIAAVVTLNLLHLGDPCFGIALLAGLCLGAVEELNRRDFITSSHLVRQSGLFGGRRLMIPLADIERVEYSYPRFGERFQAGNVEVTAQKRGLTYIGVPEPEELAAFILQARELALHRQESEPLAD